MKIRSVLIVAEDAIIIKKNQPITMNKQFSYIEQFMTPSNAFYLPDADGEGSFGDPDCGDSVTFFIKVQNHRIQDISYLVFGCCGSIATSSVLSILAKGKKLEEAYQIKEEDVFDAIEGIPPEKAHCSNIGVHALRMAIDDYLNKQKEEKNENCHPGQ